MIQSNFTWHFLCNWRKYLPWSFVWLISFCNHIQIFYSLIG